MDKPRFHTTTKRLWELLESETKRMRRKPTSAENVLWQRLRRKSLGVTFRRQHVIGRCIADFVCLSRQIVVEVDGLIHDQQRDRDIARDAYLAQHGFRVLHFTNEQVLRHLDEVIEAISASLS